MKLTYNTISFLIIITASFIGSLFPLPSMNCPHLIRVMFSKGDGTSDNRLHFEDFKLDISISKNNRHMNDFALLNPELSI